MKAALSVALALLVTACSDSTGIARNLRVQTDASVYDLPPAGPAPSQATVHFTVENTGSTTVSLPNCGATVLAQVQKQQGSNWATVSMPVCPALAVYAPIVLAPGESAEGEAFVSAAGRYRLLVVIPGPGDEEESRVALSGTFVARSLAD